MFTVYIYIFIIICIDVSRCYLGIDLLTTWFWDDSFLAGKRIRTGISAMFGRHDMREFEGVFFEQF